MSIAKKIPNSLKSDTAKALAASIRDIKCNKESINTVLTAMKSLFPKEDEKVLSDYANCVCLLSDPDAICAAMVQLDSAIVRACNFLLQQQPGQSAANYAQMITSGQLVFGKLNCNNINSNSSPCTLHTHHLSVSKVLKRCFVELGVTGLRTDLPCAVFSNAQSQAFIEVVKRGILFVDGVNAGHGEFTHTIQWLLIASAKSLPAQGALSNFSCQKDVGWLYTNSVSIVSDMPFLFEGGGTAKVDRKTMWDFVLDCFLLTDNQRNGSDSRNQKIMSQFDTSHLGSSLFADNFRSPRMVQYMLFGYAGEDRFSQAMWATSLVEVGPTISTSLLGEILRNRHTNKNLLLDMKESDFQNYYAVRAEQKAEKYSNQKYSGGFAAVLDDKMAFHPVPKEKK